MKTPSFGQRGRVLSTVAGLLVLSAFANPVVNERSVWSGVYSPSQAERGRASFETACAMCHRADLSGRGSAIPALRGEAFTSERHGGTVGDLYQLISTTMPPGRPTALSPEGYADVVAYLLS
jgi:mono/diheme cytochrome c family protein